MPTSPSPSEPPAAMSHAHHPIPSYLGALLNTNKGGHTPSVWTAKQHKKAAAAYAMTIANETNKQHQQVEVAIGHTPHYAAAINNMQQYAAMAMHERGEY